MSLTPNKFKLWVDSPTTFHHRAPSINFTKTKRFERDSIYWPPRNQQPISAIGLKNIWDEEIKTISKRIDDEEKLEKINNGKQYTRRLSLFEKSSEEKKYDRRLSYYIKSAGSTISTFNNTAASRLYQKQPKGPLSPKRDRQGLRSDQMVDNFNLTVNSMTQDVSTAFYISKKGFSNSKRMDLSRPQNFNPGPGSYKIVRFLDQQKKWLNKKIKKQQIQ